MINQNKNAIEKLLLSLRSTRCREMAGPPLGAEGDAAAVCCPRVANRICLRSCSKRDIGAPGYEYQETFSRPTQLAVSSVFSLLSFYFSFCVSYEVVFFCSLIFLYFVACLSIFLNALRELKKRKKQNKCVLYVVTSRTFSELQNIAKTYIF